jgi:hypothetical protein
MPIAGAPCRTIVEPELGGARRAPTADGVGTLWAVVAVPGEFQVDPDALVEAAKKIDGSLTSRLSFAPFGLVVRASNPELAAHEATPTRRKNPR